MFKSTTPLSCVGTRRFCPAAWLVQSGASLCKVGVADRKVARSCFLLSARWCCRRGEFELAAHTRDVAGFSHLAVGSTACAVVAYVWLSQSRASNVSS